MATNSVSPPPALSAQVIANAFVDQYYHILHQFPEFGYRFYQESSVLTRPEANGVMTSVTTTQAIKDKILSLNYKDYKAEIETADAQDSYDNGVLVLVTGCLTGSDNLRRKFTQSFFLAPQDKGYFVLNDVFRYVDENKPPETEVTAVDGLAQSISAASLTRDSEAGFDGEVCEPPHNEEELSAEVEVVLEPPVHSSQNEVHPSESNSQITEEDAQTNSYASIVKVMKENTAPTLVNLPTNNERVVPVTVKPQSNGFAASTSCPDSPESSTPNSNNASDSGNALEEVEGHSIYIRNMPLNVTVFQVAEEFKKFGSIKPGGVQVKSEKQPRFCFGFVEFESLDSMHAAIQASPVIIGGRPAVIEEKRSKSRVGSGRGSFSLSRGRFRNENFRDRGNYGGGRGYGSHEFGGQGRGLSQRGGWSYQQVS